MNTQTLSLRHLAIALMAAMALAVAAIHGTPAHASDDVKIGTIEIGNIWARASAGMAGAAGVFMEIENKGSTGDRLIAASSDVAKMTQIHETRMAGGVMSMNHIKAIDLPAGAEIKLKPGSYHVMLMGLKAPLKEGTHFSLTLTFEKAGSVSVHVPVKKPGAMGHDHTKMKMKDD